VQFQKRTLPAVVAGMLLDFTEPAGAQEIVKNCSRRCGDMAIDANSHFKISVHAGKREIGRSDQHFSPIRNQALDVHSRHGSIFGILEEARRRNARRPLRPYDVDGSAAILCLPVTAY
jgi:hypothetical protein